MDGFTPFHYTIHVKYKSCSCYVFYSYYMVIIKCQDGKKVIRIYKYQPACRQSQQFLDEVLF